MKTILRLIVGICAIALCSPAFAEITNGGFESGDFTGWDRSGSTNITSAGSDPRTNNALSLVGEGTHSARVGDERAYGYGGTRYSSIRQTWAVGSTFSDLYFAWAAVGLVPTNDYPHSNSQTPWFQIQLYNVTDGATLFQQEFYTGNIGQINPGWVAGASQDGYPDGGGIDDAGIWYYRPWETFHMSVADYAGDELRITLTTRDCEPSGHASYAYLDGFGSEPPDVGQVPEPGTWLLLANGLLGLVGLKRKFRK